MTIFDPLFLEFIELLNQNEAKYILIGGYAVILNGVNRTTGDMDVLRERSIKNAEKVLKAIDDFGLGSIGFTVEDLMEEKSVIQMGRVPYRIDILNSIPGVDFEEAYSKCDIYTEDGIDVKCIHINHLINNKLAVKRDKDLSDAKALKKILNRKK